MLRRESMILLIGVVLVSIGLGYLVGGRLSGFERFRLRWWFLAFAGLALQLAPLPADLATEGLIASYVMLLVFMAVNLRAPGVWLILIGLALNLAVIAPNDGMPVSRSALVASGQASTLTELENGAGTKHHLEASDDVLTPLADVIAIGSPVNQVASAGDVLVYAGLLWLIVGVMRGARRVDPAPPWVAYQGRHRASAS